VPELPEVETIRAGLERKLVGRTIEEAEILDGRLTRPFEPAAVAAELAGERIAALERRGKYLVVRFESGRVLLIHLRMTGGLRHAPRGKLAEDPYRRAVVRLDDRSDVGYRDMRRFGTWLLLEAGEIDGYLAERLGEEPLGPGFTTRELGRRLAGRTAPIKAALLDQRTVPGLGNIYADEALWRARVHPLRPAGTLAPEELRAVHSGIRRALERGIARRGATLSDFADSEGAAGSMQDEFNVYGRLGEPCPRCGTPIEKTRAGGRGTWYCPGCQR
jgi:formamidopyrimidine-DNA glycosylase